MTHWLVAAATYNLRRTMMAKNSSPTLKSTQSQKRATATGRAGKTPRRPIQLERLEVFIGRWLTEGKTVGGYEGPALEIIASDVYEWAPGDRFVMHSAYGRIGEVGVGGLEVERPAHRHQTFLPSHSNLQ